MQPVAGNNHRNMLFEKATKVQQNGVYRCGETVWKGRKAMRSSSWQQTVDIHLALCADIYMPVHNHRDVKPQG